MAAVAAELGPVHHLVNCVAYFGSQSLEAAEADWDTSMRVNVAGTSFMVQAAVQQMRAHSLNQNCSIVNLSSISAHSTQPNRCQQSLHKTTPINSPQTYNCRWTYAASKGAINILTKNMALDLAALGIRVNSVSPGWVWSPEVAKAAGEAGRQHWEPIWGRFHISGRLCEMAEVAAAVAFLLSKDASFVNATDLKVDGGYGAMSAEGHGEASGSWAGSSKDV